MPTYTLTTSNDVFKELGSYDPGRKEHTPLGPNRIMNLTVRKEQYLWAHYITLYGLVKTPPSPFAYVRGSLYATVGGVESMDRRKFLRATAAAMLSSIAPKTAESGEQGILSMESDLSPENLQRHKSRAVASLTEEIPQGKQLGHVRSYAQNLAQESQMYLPSIKEITDVAAKSTAQLRELEQSVPLKGYGLFIFADRDSEGNHKQRLYALRRPQKGALQFVKGYAVSTARLGFGNSRDSNKTPLGLHKIDSGKRGLLGEVVAEAKALDEPTYIRLRQGGKDRWFVRGFGSVRGDDIADVVTDQYLLIGPNTDASRGIRIHGTNRAGKVENGTWTSYLGGRRRSGGCIRMSSTDIRDMYLSGYLSLPQKRGKSAVQTSVMLHATPNAMEGAGELTPEDLRELPERWERKAPEAKQEPRRAPDATSQDAPREESVKAPLEAPKRPTNWRIKPGELPTNPPPRLERP